MGGTAHLILTALTGAASGNVTGSSAQFAQAAAINVLQSYTVQEVKQIADGFTDKAQSEAVRTALQALTACAGASSKGGDCSQGAMGAASAVVLANVIEGMKGEKPIKEWADGQKANKDEEDDPITKEGLFSNLVTSLIVGITEAAGGDSVVAGWAGKTEVENNALNNGLPISSGMMDYGQGAVSLAQYLQENGATPDEIAEALDQFKKGDLSLGQQPGSQLFIASGDFIGVPVGLLVSMMSPEYKGMTLEQAADIAANIVANGIPIGKTELLEYAAANALLAVIKVDKAVVGVANKVDNVVDAPNATKSTDNLNNINTTSIAKDGLTDKMVAQMEKPIVYDLKLKNITDDLYRDNAIVGNGSTGAALRQELETGLPVGDKFHTQKAQDYVVGLEDWLKRNTNASVSDRMAAEQMLRDLKNALKGK